jgi:hypothetical protein
MQSTPTQLLRLSQGQLNLLTTCPRKFQYTYLEQLNTPPDPEQEEKQTQGSRFHLLMQQREMGLPIDNFLQVDAQLQSWMVGFANVAPEILAPATDERIFRASEHHRTLQVQDYLLTVIYDLLIADSQQAQILDWKTYPKPPRERQLEKNWQTRLYLYVLAETSTYLPEQISLTYWFVQSDSKPLSIRFSYNSAQHQQTAKKLNQLLNRLTNWLERYYGKELFPQVAEDRKICQSCQFAVRCERFSAEGAITTPLPNLDTIQEVSL